MQIQSLLHYLGDKHYYEMLGRELEGMGTILDVGCGANSPLGSVSIQGTLTGIDIFKKSITASQKNKVHKHYIVGDVTQLKKYIKRKSYDAVVALDLIEHLTKKQGEVLLGDMEYVARKKIIVMTPNGYYNQEPYGDNPYQIHKSGWSLQDFAKRGYLVYGIRGLKYLRGEQASLRFRPWLLSGGLSFISQFFVYNSPKNAYQLFAVKSI